MFKISAQIVTCMLMIYIESYTSLLMDRARKIAFDHNGPPTPYKIKVNNCKLIDLVIRIKLTSNFNATILKFSFAYFYIWKHVSWESRFRCHDGYKPYQRYMFQFISIKSVKRDEIVRPCERHSNETATVRKHVTKYKNMRKWMVECFRKFWNRGIEIARVNSILIQKSANLELFTLILYSIGGPLWYWHL